jgi:DNA-directed RNA polymerase specialized sigma24 family protein
MRDGDERRDRHAQEPDRAESDSDDSVLLVTPADAEAVDELLTSGFAAPERSRAKQWRQMLDRACADADWLDRLRQEGFEGPRYELIKHCLAGYALPVIHAFIRSRTIFVLSTERGRPVSCDDSVKRWLANNTDDRSELAAEIITDALRLLRNVGLMGGRWDPRLGASLPTYFVGAAISVFANTFRRWLRQYKLANKVDAVADVETDARAPDDPAAIVCANDLLRRILEAAHSGPMRDTIRALVEDTPCAEVAAKYGISEAALKQKLYRWRKWARDREEFR